MNAAYLLESQSAIYPRVLIDETVLRIARRARSAQHSAHEEAEYARAFMTKDEDGRYFFDYVSWTSVVAVTGGENDGYGAYLGKLGFLIREGLRHDDPRVQAKFLWLRKKYLAALKPFRDLPADHAYRSESPGLAEAIARLPRFKADAKLARAAVKAARKPARQPKGR